MYHELTPKMERRRGIIRFASFLIALILAAVVWYCYDNATHGLHEQGALSVREAIMDTAKQVCAVEGSYPSSLSYMEENYGLTINHDDYVITYEAFADNIMPSVVVIAR